MNFFFHVFSVSNEFLPNTVVSVCKVFQQHPSWYFPQLLPTYRVKSNYIWNPILLSSTLPHQQLATTNSRCMRPDMAPGVFYFIYWRFIRLNVEKGKKSTSILLLLLLLKKHDKNYELWAYKVGINCNWKKEHSK